MKIPTKLISKNYGKKVDELNPEEKIKLAYITIKIMSKALRLKVALLNKYNQRWLFALYKFDSYRKFARYEVFKACEELTQVDLEFNWIILNPELSLILKRDAKWREDLDNWNSENSRRKKELLWKIISSAGLVEEYMNLDTKLIYPRLRFNPNEIKKLPAFDKIVELIGRLEYLDFLMMIIQEKDYGKMALIKMGLPPLPDIFINPDDFNKYIHLPQIEEMYVVFDDGTYHLKDRNKTLLAGFAHRLLHTGKLIEEIKTSQDLAKVFCSFFHVRYNEKEEKQFQPDRAKTDEFSFIV